MTAALEALKVATPDPGVMLVTLDRPEARNAIDTRMGRELRELFVPLKFTPGELRCIVVTGAGDRAFCAGGDLKERRGMAEADWRAQHAIFEEAFYAVMECAVPVIAAVNGAAYAGGCELALACDFIYASREARFALTEATLGIIPGCGGTQHLPRAVGERRAKELIFTGEPFTAAEAFEWGLVNRLCEPAAVVDEALAAARRIADNAPVSVRQAKQAIHQGLQMDIMSGLRHEVQCYERTLVTEDRREGIEAFNEKRKPRYRGR